MRSLKVIFAFLFLIYISGLPNRLGYVTQPMHEVIIIFFSLTGLFSFSLYLSKYRYKIEALDAYILFYLFIYPVISSLVAWYITSQPLYMGILTFRGFYIIFVYYTILLFRFPAETVLNYVEKTVIFIMLLITVLFVFFDLNDFNVLFRKGNLVIQYGLTTTKGMQFSGFTCLFFIPFIAGWVKYFERNKLVYLIIPAFIFIFSVMISKARNEILTLAIIPLIMYYIRYKFYDLKFLTITIVIISAFFIILMTDNLLSRSFSGLTKLDDLEFARKTGDYSAYLRIEEIRDGWKWFIKYPLTGLGSLSYRYNNGYMGVVSDFFFLSDIGIIGVLVKGGVILFGFYMMFYARLINYFTGSGLYSIIGRYLVFALLIELMIGNDYLVNYTGVMVVIFLLKPLRPELRPQLTS